MVSRESEASAEAELHRAITRRLLIETVAIFALLGAAALWAWSAHSIWRWPIALAQGCWLQRIYVVGHEAVHRKLLPGQGRRNDALGQVLLLPLLLPLRIYRKIHDFHHGHNRRDEGTAALDTFVFRRPPGPLGRLYAHVAWYLAVFAGGFFFHGVISVLLFLLLPLKVARRVSPAFRGWKRRDQLKSIATFAAAVGLHVGIGLLFGRTVWIALLGAPLLTFAWVYSLLIYIYHYDTDYGPHVRFHVRSLRPITFMSWWLLNFNEHATHHRRPSLPWHRLPAEHRPMPEAHADNQKVETIGAAILHQLRGPKIVVRPPAGEAETA